MPKPIEIRAYKHADAELKQHADSLKACILRDATEFATRNVLPEQMDAFQLLIDAFDNTTTDQELLGEISAATIEKDSVAEELRKAIRPIRNMAEVVYGTRGKYEIFGFEDMARLSDANLCRMGKRVVRVATKLLPELASQGLTQAQIDAVAAQVTNLDKKIDKLAEAEENRDIETQDRIQKGNALYKEISRLASIGKSLFQDTNEARYNDYVIYGAAGGDTPAPPAA